MLELEFPSHPPDKQRMFKTILGNDKTAEVEFRDQEKYRSLPGLALPAICFLDEYLTKDMKVFEWGSGASTIFFIQRCKELTSIEHDIDWYNKIGEAFSYRIGFALGDHVLLTPQKGFNPDYASSQPGYEAVNFQLYLWYIERFADELFDVILVDGRARVACLKAAQPKVKPGGLLILDDSQRIKYHRAMAEIDWPVIHFEGDIPYYRHGRTVRTTIWVKE